jgi:hypothetical protein
MKNKNFYKSLLEAVKKQLNEISEEELEKTNIVNYLKRKTSKQLNEIFENADRIAIPFSQEDSSDNSKDSQLLGYINELRKQGWTIDFNEPFGYATKVVESKVGDKVYQNKKKVKIGPLIIALGKEAEKFWQENNKFYTTKQNEFYFRNKYSIIISRVPIDILRMSDHDDWSSCHSPSREDREEGSFYKCAISEAVEGGAIAYVVKQEELDKVNLTDPEIFKDKARNFDGISPISRLRIRRILLTQPDPIEIGLPEKKVYGQNFPGFYKQLASFLEIKQKNEIDKIRNKFKKNKVDLKQFKVYGGSYYDRDGTIKQLFDEFFGTSFKTVGNVSKVESNIEKEFFHNRFKNTIKRHNIESAFSTIGTELREDEYDKEHIQPYCNIEYIVDVEFDQKEQILNSINNLKHSTAYTRLTTNLQNIIREFTGIDDHFSAYSSAYIYVNFNKIEGNKIQLSFEISAMFNNDQELQEISRYILLAEKNQKKLIDKIRLSILTYAEVELGSIRNRLNQVKDFNPYTLEIDDKLKIEIKSNLINIYDTDKKYNEIMTILDSSVLPYALKQTVIEDYFKFERNHIMHLLSNQHNRFKLREILLNSFSNSSEAGINKQLSIFDTKQKNNEEYHINFLLNVLDLHVIPRNVWSANRKKIQITFVAVLNYPGKEYYQVFTDFIIFLDKNMESIREYYSILFDSFYDRFISSLKDSIEYYKNYKVWNRKVDYDLVSIYRATQSKLQMKFPLENKLFYLDGNTWRIIK